MSNDSISRIFLPLECRAIPPKKIVKAEFFIREDNQKKYISNPETGESRYCAVKWGISILGVACVEERAVPLHRFNMPTAGFSLVTPWDLNDRGKVAYYGIRTDRGAHLFEFRSQRLPRTAFCYLPHPGWIELQVLGSSYGKSFTSTLIRKKTQIFLDPQYRDLMREPAWIISDLTNLDLLEHPMTICSLPGECDLTSMLIKCPPYISEATNLLQAAASMNIFSDKPISECFNMECDINSLVGKKASGEEVLKPFPNLRAVIKSIREITSIMDTESWKSQLREMCHKYFSDTDRVVRIAACLSWINTLSRDEMDDPPDFCKDEYQYAMSIVRQAERREYEDPNCILYITSFGPRTPRGYGNMSFTDEEIASTISLKSDFKNSLLWLNGSLLLYPDELLAADEAYEDLRVYNQIVPEESSLSETLFRQEERNLEYDKLEPLKLVFTDDYHIPVPIIGLRGEEVDLPVSEGIWTGIKHPHGGEIRNEEGNALALLVEGNHFDRSSRKMAMVGYEALKSGCIILIGTTPCLQLTHIIRDKTLEGRIPKEQNGFNGLIGRMTTYVETVREPKFLLMAAQTDSQIEQAKKFNALSIAFTLTENRNLCLAGVCHLYGSFPLSKDSFYVNPSFMKSPLNGRFTQADSLCGIKIHYLPNSYGILGMDHNTMSVISSQSILLPERNTRRVEAMILLSIWSKSCQGPSGTDICMIYRYCNIYSLSLHTYWTTPKNKAITRTNFWKKGFGYSAPPDDQVKFMRTLCRSAISEFRPHTYSKGTPKFESITYNEPQITVVNASKEMSLSAVKGYSVKEIDLALSSCANKAIQTLIRPYESVVKTFTYLAPRENTCRVYTCDPRFSKVRDTGFGFDGNLFLVIPRIDYLCNEDIRKIASRGGSLPCEPLLGNLQDSFSLNEGTYRNVWKIIPRTQEVVAATAYIIKNLDLNQLTSSLELEITQSLMEIKLIEADFETRYPIRYPKLKNERSQYAITANRVMSDTINRVLGLRYKGISYVRNVPSTMNLNDETIAVKSLLGDEREIKLLKITSRLLSEKRSTPGLGTAISRTPYSAPLRKVADFINVININRAIKVNIDLTDITREFFRRRALLGVKFIPREYVLAKGTVVNSIRRLVYTSDAQIMMYPKGVYLAEDSIYKGPAETSSVFQQESEFSDLADEEYG